MDRATQAQKIFNARFRRFAFVMLMISGLYLLGVSPVRSYLEQRSQMEHYEHKARTLKEANAQLEQRAALLQSDAEVERLARTHYELVPKGREAYAVMPASSTTTVPAKK